ncbi:MAG: hypothetical protein GXO03_01820 [Aquificae bacterium]|nr:hypothetical protein [Aquificota bacterium]
MRAFKLLLLLSISFAAVIEDRVVVKAWVEKDRYRLSLRVKAEGKREREVLKALTAADRAVRSTGLPYRGGNFTLKEKLHVDPVTRLPRRLGFEGSAVYTFLLKGPEEQVKLLEALEAAKKEAPFSYTITAAGWELTPEKRQRVIRELKRRALEEALKEVELFSKVLGRSCELKRVRFYEPKVRPLPAGAVQPKAPFPVKEDEAVELELQYTAECPH